VRGRGQRSLSAAKDVARKLRRIDTPWVHRAIAWSASLIVAGIVALLAPGWIEGLLRAVAAYDAGAIVLLAFYWLVSVRADPGDTQCRAALEDPGRNIALSIVLLSVVAGLVSAVLILGHGVQLATVQERAASYALGIIAVISGWFLIHTTFMFRYAHLYYFDSDEDGTAERGLRFPGETNPNDYDFAYYSFVIGMTFQVSDVSITDPGVRRFTLFHALISFGYNTMIIALVINVLSGLFH
jgi:uncharacterized membrane protein